MRRIIKKTELSGFVTKYEVDFSFHTMSIVMYMSDWANSYETWIWSTPRLTTVNRLDSFAEQRLEIFHLLYKE